MVARVTATERTVLAYAHVFILVFLYTSVKTASLIGCRDTSHCPLYMYTYIFTYSYILILRTAKISEMTAGINLDESVCLRHMRSETIFRGEWGEER